MNKHDPGLAAHARQYQQILDSVDDLILLKGPRSQIVWANRAFREFYGMSNEELRNLIDAPFANPDSTLKYVQDDLAVFTSGKSLNIPLESATGKNGEIRYLHTLKTPIVDDTGKVIMTVGVSRDITDKTRTDTILAAQKASMVMASKMSSLGEMASGIAHEINNPLAIIQTLAGQLSEMLAEGELSPKFLGEQLREIERTSERISKIIRSLRSFSRDDSSDPLEEVTLYSVVEQTLGICGERFKNHDTRIDVNVSPDEAPVSCHPVQLSQVLLNLLNNAHDAIAPLTDRWIRIESSRTEDYQILSVQDSGTKIPPEVAEKMMTPFFTTKVVGVGTGLGLSISHGIMKSLGGSLEYDASSPHTRFFLKIPSRKGEPA